MPPTSALFAVSAAVGCALAQQVPAAAQIVNQKIFNVLASVPPPAVANDSTVRHSDALSLLAEPSNALTSCSSGRVLQKNPFSPSRSTFMTRSSTMS